MAFTYETWLSMFGDATEQRLTEALPSPAAETSAGKRPKRAPRGAARKTNGVVEGKSDATMPTSDQVKRIPELLDEMHVLVSRVGSPTPEQALDRLRMKALDLYLILQALPSSEARLSPDQGGAAPKENVLRFPPRVA